MEVDHSSPSENFDQVAEQQGPTQTQQVRSYECTFCKRGFSNAQALGGHMNIHRRDRAKLKEPKKDPSSLLPPPPLPMISATKPDGSLESESSEDKGCTPRQPWGKFRQLQLFAERPSSSTDGKQTQEIITDGSSADMELDLELRLGLES